MPYPLVRVSTDLESSFCSGTRKETPLQVEISFIDVNFPYKMVIPTLISELLQWLLFLKIILKLEETYLDVVYSGLLHNL